MDHNDAVSKKFFIKKIDEMVMIMMRKSGTVKIKTHIANALKVYDERNKKDRSKDISDHLPFVIELEGGAHFKSMLGGGIRTLLNAEFSTMRGILIDIHRMDTDYNQRIKKLEESLATLAQLVKQGEVALLKRRCH